MLWDLSLSLGAWWPEGRSSSSVSQFLPSCSGSACQMEVKLKDLRSYHTTLRCTESVHFLWQVTVLTCVWMCAVQVRSSWIIIGLLKRKCNANPLSAKRCIRILGVPQAAWHTRCDDEVSLHFNVFFFSLSRCWMCWTHSCGAAHSKYSGKREH